MTPVLKLWRAAWDTRYGYTCMSSPASTDPCAGWIWSVAASNLAIRLTFATSAFHSAAALSESRPRTVRHSPSFGAQSPITAHTSASAEPHPQRIAGPGRGDVPFTQIASGTFFIRCPRCEWRPRQQHQFELEPLRPVD